MGTLRLLLALNVVLLHMGGAVGLIFPAGVYAVPVFFMISGFLMQLVLDGRYADPRDRGRFYLNRALRILPPYWAVLIVTVLVAAWIGPRSGFFDFGRLLPSLPLTDALFVIGTNALILGQDLLMLLQRGSDGLHFVAREGVAGSAWSLAQVPQAWSLAFELYFYAMAPFLARLRSRWLVALVVAGLALKAVLAMRGLAYDPWDTRFFPTALPFFLAGMLAWRWREVIVRDERMAVGAGAALILVALLANPLIVLGQWLHLRGWMILYGAALLTMAGLPALHRLSPQIGTRWRRWDDIAGELSYPIYLVHLLVLVIALRGGAKAIAAPLFVIALTIASIAAAWLLTLLVERPVERMRARFKP